MALEATPRGVSCALNWKLAMLGYFATSGSRRSVGSIITSDRHHRQTMRCSQASYDVRFHINGHGAVFENGARLAAGCTIEAGIPCTASGIARSGNPLYN